MCLWDGEPGASREFEGAMFPGQHGDPGRAAPPNHVAYLTLLAMAGSVILRVVSAQSEHATYVQDVLCG